MSLYAIGEALIDFLPEKKCFFPVVGGAPANVASCYSRLDGDSYFVGKIGDDMFGKLIISTLKDIGVKTNFIYKTNKANTALSFVSLKENGEREFSFYRKPSADMFLTKKEIKNINFNCNDILHFCSVDLIDKPVKHATLKAIKTIKKANGFISFDPNIRKNLWENLNDYRKVVHSFIPFADIIKVSDEECDFLFNNKDYDKIANELLNTSEVVIITLGKDGSFCYINNKKFYQQAFKIKCIDTTGAGDSYIGAFLRFFNKKDFSSIPIALKKAAATSAIVCGKKGVLSSLPNNTEIEKFLQANNE